MDQNEVPLEHHHLGVPSGASKMISESMVRSVQTMHLFCTDANSISNQTETRFHMTHITYKFHRVRPKQFLTQWYIHRKPCTYFASILALSPNKLKWLPLEPRHIRLPSGASKTITEPMVHLARIMHPSCTDTNTVSKQTEMRFDMTHIT
jgi:hypothetical protein